MTWYRSTWKSVCCPTSAIAVNAAMSSLWSIEFCVYWTRNGWEIRGDQKGVHMNNHVLIDYYLASCQLSTPSVRYVKMIVFMGPHGHRNTSSLALLSRYYDSSACLTSHPYLPCKSSCCCLPWPFQFSVYFTLSSMMIALCFFFFIWLSSKSGQLCHFTPCVSLSISVEMHDSCLGATRCTLQLFLRNFTRFDMSISISVNAFRVVGWSRDLRRKLEDLACSVRENAIEEKQL